MLLKELGFLILFLVLKMCEISRYLVYYLDFIKVLENFIFKLDIRNGRIYGK